MSEREKAWDKIMMDYWDQAWWEYPAEDMSQDEARIRRHTEFYEAFLSGEDLPPVTRPYAGWRPWHRSAHLIKEAENNINKSIARRESTKKNIQATRAEIAKIKKEGA